MVDPIKARLQHQRNEWKIAWYNQRFDGVHQNIIKTKLLNNSGFQNKKSCFSPPIHTGGGGILGIFWKLGRHLFLEIRTKKTRKSVTGTVNCQWSAVGSSGSAHSWARVFFSESPRKPQESRGEINSAFGLTKVPTEARPTTATIDDQEQRLLAQLWRRSSYRDPPRDAMYRSFLESKSELAQRTIPVDIWISDDLMYA